MGELLEVKRLKKQINKKGGKHILLKDVNFIVNQAEFMTIIGDCFSGKSTLLRILAGIDRDMEGSVIINGSDISKMEEGLLSGFRNENIGIVLGRLTPIMRYETVSENIKSRMEFKTENFDIEKRITEILERFNLAPLRDTIVSMISGWDLMRLMIAAAIAPEPYVVLVDETLDSFELTEMDYLLNILLEYKSKNNAAVVMVTHCGNIIKKADRVVLLKEGMIEELNIDVIRN